MNKHPLFVAFLFCVLVSAQHKSAFGTLSPSEKEFRAYVKDSTATAIYLFERGDNYFEVRNNYVWLIKKYHAKIKVLTKNGYDHATIDIPYYHNADRKEVLKNIRAVTHNGTIKNSVRNEQIFSVDVSENWSEKRFTFPNVKEGSILEYSYELVSPFHFNLTGWQFQSDIPKIYSEYNAKIPGNWVYNRSLIGELKLDVNEADVEKNCFTIPTASEAAACEVLKYIMKDVPAFEESEDFMLSGRNYRSRLEFELSEYQSFKGYTKKYTKTWQDVDREFKWDKDIGRQLRKKNFFEKNVPLNLFTDGSSLQTAKNIYAFVQNHFTWNEKYGIWYNNRVKKAFEERKGNVAEINIALINLLNAAGIKTDMMLTATRQRGLPKRNRPVMSDFNYIIAKTTIDGKNYLLDATDKKIPFGMLPFRCLNYYGRVMDFEQESYWLDIEPIEQNKRIVRAQMNFDLDKGFATGGFRDISSGYESISQKSKLNSLTEEEYLQEIEAGMGDDFYIVSRKKDEKLNQENVLGQSFEFELENILQHKTIYTDLFLIKFFDENPFLAKERHYPIDFGYLRDYNYSLTMAIPNGYQVRNLPRNVGLKLPGNSGFLHFSCEENGTRVNVFFELKLNATQYRSEGYEYIKEFFSKAVKVQTQSYVTLEKI